MCVRHNDCRLKKTAESSQHSTMPQNKDKNKNNNNSSGSSNNNNKLMNLFYIIKTVQ